MAVLEFDEISAVVPERDITEIILACAAMTRARELNNLRDETISSGTIRKLINKLESNLGGRLTCRTRINL